MVTSSFHAQDGHHTKTGGVQLTGQWSIEYLPFFTAGQVQAAQENGCAVVPSATNMEQELFRGVSRQHATVEDIKGRSVSP